MRVAAPASSVQRTREFDAVHQMDAAAAHRQKLSEALGEFARTRASVSPWGELDRCGPYGHADGGRCGWVGGSICRRGDRRLAAATSRDMTSIDRGPSHCMRHRG